MVLGTVEDFSKAPPGPLQKGFLDSWRWTSEQRELARGWSHLEIAPNPESGGRMLRVQIHDRRALAPPSIPILRLAPFYPPEADGLRIRLKVLSGSASVFIGGPTAYYANSDVFTEPQTVRALEPPQWVEVVCNFNQPTWRNYRRAGFSADAPRNYYSRWAQEPVGIFLGADSEGEFLIDRIDLVALGEGRPFPTFPAAQIQMVETIADFEDGKLGDAFTLYMAAAEAEWFEQSWTRTKPLRFEPATLSVVGSGTAQGRRALVSLARTAEEVHCTGVRTAGAAKANAIAATVRVEAPDRHDALVGVGEVVPMDFLVFAAPAGRPFPWDRFAASAELRSHAHGGPVEQVGFDYQFTHRVVAGYSGVDFAIYQTRRYLKPGEWTELILPTADFTCVYGQGAMRPRLLGHEPLRGAEIIAVAWMNPWCRQGRQESAVTMLVDTLAFVHVPGSPAEHRSFWQVPDLTQLESREDTETGQRTRHFWMRKPEPR